jgi:hypothetical protein
VLEGRQVASRQGSGERKQRRVLTTLDDTNRHYSHIVNISNRRAVANRGSGSEEPRSRHN